MREGIVGSSTFRTTRERLTCQVLAASFAVLALTGLSAVVRGSGQTGWLLLLHVAAGGVFAPALAVAAVTWAERHRFARGAVYHAAQAAFFWAALLLGLGQMVTAALSMTGLFGQDGMMALRAIHRYGGIALAVTAFPYAYFAMSARRFAAPVTGEPQPNKE